MNREGLAIDIGYDIKNPGAINDVVRGLDNAGKAANEASGQFVKVAGSLREIAVSQKSFVSSARDGSLAFRKQGVDLAFAGEATNKLMRQQQALIATTDRAKKSTQNYNGTLSGFNNIIRDAPFGIIGIGNNITQLSDSFSQLQKSTGSTRAALTATIGSLFSPAGIFTIGLSAAISLWTVYSQRQQSAASEAKKAAVNIKGLSDILRETAKGISENNAATLGEVATLNRLFEVAKNETNSRKTRVAALNELKSATNGYLDTLTLETIGTDKARESLDAFNRSLFQGAILKAYEGQVQALAKSFAEQEQNATQGRKALKEFNDAILRERQRINSGQQARNVDQAAFDRDLRNNRAREDIIRQTNNAIKEQNRLQDEILATGVKIADLQTKINPFSKETISDLKKANEEFSKIRATVLDLSINDEINKGRRQDIFIKPQPIDIKQPINIDLIGLPQQLEKAEKQIGEFQYGVGLSAEKALIDVEGILERGAASVASGIANAVGGIISGAMKLKDGLNSIIIVFADFIGQLGEALIAAGTATIAAAALSTNPYTAIAAGIIAVAAAAAVKGAINKAPSFATGGTVFGPTMALVGDNPARKEHILSDAQLQTISGSNMKSVEVYGRLRGRDIELSNRRSINQGLRTN